MAISEEERKKLEKLPQTDLIDMLDKLREENEQNSKKAIEERTRIMKEFFDGKGKAEEEDGEDTGETAFRKSDAFKRLKARFK